MNRVRAFLKQMFSFDRRWVLVMLGISVGLALLITGYLLSYDGVFGAYFRKKAEMLGFLICFPMGIVVCGLIIISLLSIIRTKSIVPTLVLFIGALLTPLIIFIIPIPKSLEHRHFLANRNDYEWAVEHHEQLSPSDCDVTFYPRDEHTYDSALGCVYKTYHPELGLVMSFHPYDVRYGVVYVENDIGDLCLTIEVDYFGGPHLADHWYLCTFEII